MVVDTMMLINEIESLKIRIYEEKYKDLIL